MDSIHQMTPTCVGDEPGKAQPISLYLPPCVVKKKKRYILGLVLMRRREKAQAVVERLLAYGRRLGLRLQRLYLDRGFDNNRHYWK